MHDLVEDVLNWKTFYLSGRLQKPVCLPSNAFLVLFFFLSVSPINLLLY